jgi:HPr kinase/phosphorylase
LAHLKIRIRDLYEKYAEELELKLHAGLQGIDKYLTLPGVERPGLALAGYTKGFISKQILVFGKSEHMFLKELPSDLCRHRLLKILKTTTPAVIVAHSLSSSKILKHLCEELTIPLLCSSLPLMTVQSRLIAILVEQFTPVICYHGSFVEVFGMGVLIQGNSAVGKSEAALGLIKKGHRLVSDDLVKVRRLETGLEGFGAEMTRHHMEVRGIGIINVAMLFGAACVAEKKNLDIVVKLEVWDDTHFYERAGIEEKTMTILGREVPYHLLPVKPGRDVVLLLETIALNHKLKAAGLHAARNLDHQLLAAIERK